MAGDINSLNLLVLPEIRTGDTRHIQQIQIDQVYMYHCALVPISKSFFTLMHVVTMLRFE